MHWFLVAIVALGLALALISYAGTRWIEHRFPPIGDFVTVDGIRLHYVDQGSGPPLVLLHGASSNLRDLASSLLPALVKDHRVLVFDRPGYGYSERPAGDWPDPARVAALVLDAAHQLGAERPLLVGHSWSGSVVMAALVEMPDRVAGGALIAGVAGHWAGSAGTNYTIGGLPLIGRLFAHTLVFPLGHFAIPRVTTAVLHPDAVPDGYADGIGAKLALRPRQFRNNIEDMNRLSPYMQRLSTRYHDIDRPLLLIHGEADTVVPFWNHGERLLPIVRGVQVHRIAGAGHAPHHTHRDEVAAELRRFVGEAVR